MVDFLASLNKYGSGMNISEVVRDLATAELSTRRSSAEKSIEQAEIQVSALGEIRNELEILDETLAIAAQGRGLSASSSDSAVMVEVTDYPKLTTGKTDIEVTQLAKAQVLEFGGIASTEDLVGEGVLAIEFGTWAEDGTFTADTSRQGSAISTTSTTTYGDLAGLMDSIDGVNINLIDVGDGTYSFGVTSDTGAQNALRITVTANTTTNPLDPLAPAPEPIALEAFDTTTTNDTRQVVAAQDAKLSVDGIAISRQSNEIDDAVAGMTLTLRNTTTSTAAIDVENDPDIALTFMAGFIDQTNLALSAIKEVSQRGLNGVGAGDLAGDPTIAAIERELKSILRAPIFGYGERSISLADMGVQTQRDGSLYLNENEFRDSYLKNPAGFEAVMRDGLSSTNSLVTLSGTATQSSTAGRYSFERDATTGAATLNGIGLTQVSSADGKTLYRATSGALTGIQIEVPNDLTSTEIDFGRSMISQLRSSLDDVLSSTGAMTRREQDFSSTISDAQDDLDSLTLREQKLIDRYTTQFTAMEIAISQLNSTGEYLTNLVAAWNKDS